MFVVAIGQQSGFEVAELENLTSAGVTSSIRTTGVDIVFQVTTSSIGTNVVVRFEGSLDDTNFFNLDQDELDTTITANGTRGFALNGCPTKYVRLRLVSFTGGTPTVAAKVGAA